MRDTLFSLLVAAGITVSIGFLVQPIWPYFVMGAVLALVLWVMLFAGSYALPGRQTKGRVAPVKYFIAGVVAVLLAAFIGIFTKNAAFAAVGFIIAGAIVSPIGNTRSTERA